MSLRAALRSESGQASIELGSMAVWLLIAGLLAWQLALVGWTAVSTADAARTAARLYSRGATITQAKQGGTNSLSSRDLANGDEVNYLGNGEWQVVVKVPIVLPGLQLSKHFEVTRTATIPYTG